MAPQGRDIEWQPAASLAEIVSLLDSGADGVTLSSVSLSSADDVPLLAAALARARETLRGLMLWKMPHAAPVLPQSMPALRELIFGNASLRDSVDAFASAVKGMPALQRLDLCFNALGNDGIGVLAPALDSLTRLRELSICQNVVGDAAMLDLGPVLESMPALSVLDLQDNELGPEGIETLAASLRNMSALRELNLFDNEIGSAGMRTLTAVIAECPLLEDVPGAEAVAQKAVESNLALKKSHFTPCTVDSLAALLDGGLEDARLRTAFIGHAINLFFDAKDIGSYWALVHRALSLLPPDNIHTQNLHSFAAIIYA